MKKIYRMENLDCANCAAKMENKIKTISGINSVSISFMTQKMTIDFAEEQIDDIMKKVCEACKKIEPDCTIIL